ncbi:MAG: DHA2 family efflux MFS transporter permease subunit [Anaerolineae bacterium]|nr:MAG: DHA2 family efflux MFS transporter permease subunit [Anaerolineae bacterium]
MTEQRTDTTGRWVLLATILASSMAFIDSTVVNVALPSIQTALDATVSELQWIVEAYLLFLASLILVGGSLGDHYGRKRVFGLGVALFAAASAWCGFAGSAGQLVLARALQGVGGALLTPGSLAIITAYFVEEQRGRAIGMWSAFSAMTTLIGPVLGGWLVDNGSWRWVFLINLPVAAVVLAALYLRVPESKDGEAARRLDWGGALFATLGLGGISYGLIESSNLGLSDPTIMTALIGGILLLGIFVLYESRIRQPMMPLGMFKNSTFSGANLLTFFLYGALSWVTFFAPLNLIQIQGYTGTQFGLAFIPFPILLFLLSTYAGGLVPKIGARPLLVSGSLLVAAGFFWFGWTGQVGSSWGGYFANYFPVMVLMGLGMSAVAAPLSATVMGAVTLERSGIASGINNAVARTASLVIIAFCGLLAVVWFGQSLEARVAELGLPAPAQQELLAQRTRLAEAQPPDGLSEITEMAVRQAVNGAFLTSFRYTMWLTAGLAVLSAGVAWITIPARLNQ